MRIATTAIVVLSVGLMGFATKDKKSAPPSFVEIVEQVQHGICSIVAARTPDEIGMPVGSGFFINADGYFITNAHVARYFSELVSQRLSVGLYFPRFDFVAGKSGIVGMGAADVSFVDIDDASDIAIGHSTNIRGGKAGFLHMQFDQPIPSGTEVALSGFPLGEKFPITMTASIASQIESTSYFFVDRPIFHGFSGSPVYLRSSGVVVGIASRSFNAGIETRAGPSTDLTAPAFGQVLTLDILRGKLAERKIEYNQVLP